MTEVRIVPRVRTESKTIHTPVSKCGENWFKSVRIRAPYKGTDLAYRTLPSLGDPRLIESFDGMFLEEVRGDLIRISTFVKGNAITLTPRQSENIQIMLDRASRYLKDAKAILDGWAGGFGTMSVGTIPAWPLGGQPTAPVNDLMEEGHHRDQERYKKLVRSALRNLRCAEEVAKKATIRARNKVRAKGRRFANISGEPQDAPPVEMGVLDLGETIHGEIEPTTKEMSLDESELMQGDIVLDEEAEEEVVEEPISEEPETAPEPAPEPAKKSKKKDNSALLVGAAALGILALKGR